MGPLRKVLGRWYWRLFGSRFEFIERRTWDLEAELRTRVQGINERLTGAVAHLEAAGFGLERGAPMTSGAPGHGTEIAPRSRPLRLASGRPPFRMALLGTPRSGNTWFRLLLADACGVAAFAEHRIDDFPWGQMPEEFILQLHARPTHDVWEMLKRNEIRPVALARHPLDVLLSILQFASPETESARWLDGEGGDELALVGAAPTDEAFIRYAVGPRADALLTLTPDWYEDPGCARVRYEDMVVDPDAALRWLLGPWADQDRIASAVRRRTFTAMREVIGNRHAWQGRPGLWRELLPASVAEPIVTHHACLMRILGYAYNPDTSLTRLAAQTRWTELTASHGEQRRAKTS